MNSVRATVAKFLGVQAKDLAFVDNASGGMSAIFRSMIVPNLLNSMVGVGVVVVVSN
jgi:selenocysteine lyase/cysteine desulfurase